jgi:hypothetical protein
VSLKSGFEKMYQILLEEAITSGVFMSAFIAVLLFFLVIGFIHFFKIYQIKNRIRKQVDGWFRAELNGTGPYKVDLETWNA